MGLLDVLRTKLSPAREKVADLARRHGGGIDHGIESAARMVDRRTGGRFGDRIESGTARARHAVDRIARRDDDGGAPPASPS
ncbi:MULTISPECIES: antitoxin [Streptomyces]|uniref:Antitoxin n=1 Tax=Streptomyces sudanensis TaxID=436397 RepID=A0ABY4THD5_9ACTN|nr:MULTISPECIES: antitoxin [Streptomyces]URN17198.1 antitoxin [Streptomyces sudanensis]